MYYGEKFNSITHLIGAILALIGLGALLTIALQQDHWRIIVGFSVFGATLVLLYTMSTLYHSLQPANLKKIFQTLDHVCIYLLIAGTYTPYMLLSLQGDDGLLMLSVVWGLAFFGLIMDIVIKQRIEWLQILIYLAMGWVCVFKYSALMKVIPGGGIIWLTVGGVAYTLGVIFYVLDDFKKLRHAHGIWHLFVLMGSISHFISIAFYVR
ncbi:PAQR family membrane homeostasis protein TrhA [Psychromonas sp. 14N.309.X.WAT.B.A12]|uniref:PAQR family membrane homeostasis protein TrhA n=1 Tax=unclassified Psychromonas TaxID=2614957 RepID=UPI0025B0E958|nr:hemolysin III family protein [Psychromonas sp. 14N.309.X.WAT.B.A12]MDN2662251.1 hemolysin III family protein [Psychromonas sp. 14N.309.X.WAT.B.A12]